MHPFLFVFGLKLTHLLINSMFSEIYFALYERQKRITFFIISVPSTGHSMVTCPVTLTEGRFVKRMNEVRFVK